MAPPLRISLPIDVWNPSRGGAERYLARLAGELAKRGHDVTVLCLSARDGDAPHPEGLHVERIAAPRFPRWLRELRFAQRCAHAHRRSGRDVLFAVRHALEADVYQPHGGSLRASREGQGRALSSGRRRLRDAAARLRPSLGVLLWLDREVFNCSPRLVTISLSQKVEDDFRRLYPDVEFRFQRIPNPVDTDAFHDRDRAVCSEALRVAFAVPAGKPVAVFAAHHFGAKGLRQGLQALREAPDWYLVVAGRDRIARFARVASSWGVSDRTRFAGDVSDLRPLYAGADAFLLPTFYDACSLSALEAMACGTPAITTRANGAADLIEDGVSGKIIDDPEDTRALAAALEQIARSASSFRAGASRRASLLGWNGHVDRIENVLSEVARRK